MCGIAGIIHKNQMPVAVSDLQRMVDAVAHRGPDGEGIALFGPVGLGHRRLSILDLSDAGKQPMAYGESGLTIIHNGEIYNYRELRDELKTRGYVFHSDSDTEVILAAFDAWGEDCVTRFNGMWAFAIHDARRQRLFCSRDRFGVKPFYYIDTGELFAFGSEIRQLLPLLPQTVAHRSSIETFLITQGSELGEDTFFSSVRRLAAGHSLGYDLKDGTYRIRSYYSIQRRENITALDRDSAAEAFHALLTDSVSLRLRSDVKVGTCLSGGLDSSTVATIAASLYGGVAFAAITAVSEQHTNNEAHFAGEIAAHSKLDWYQVCPSYEDFVDALPAVVRAQEEPFGGPSINMQYAVMQTARQHGIPVLLDGQGGDELLLGYERYYTTAIRTMLRERGLKPTLAELALIRRHNSKMNRLNLAKYLLGVSSASLRYAYYRYQHRYLQSLPPLPSHLAAVSDAAGDAWAMQSLDVTTNNLPILLRYEDKNSMAWGVETRLPFLDYRMVEFALSLPTDYKIHEGWTKWILRRAMQGRMPDSITWRKNKFGFEAPEQLWLPQHDTVMRAAIMASPLLRELAQMQKLETLYPRMDYRSRFRLYSIALWEQAFGVSGLA